LHPYFVELGLQLPSFSWPGGPAAISEQLVKIALAAEEAGFNSLWVMDHFFQLPPATGWGGPDQPMLEAYTTLGFLAGATNRVRLGAMVTGSTYRAPGLLAKAVTSLDVLSRGRAWLGIGAGWYEREALGLGLPFPPRGERFERLEESLQIILQLWAGERTPFQGRYFHLAEPILNPAPIQRPHPPILIGGNGERRTLRLVALYGDACNILVPDPGESRAKLAVLRRHCQELGRDYDRIKKTSLVELDLRPGRMSVPDAVARIEGQAEEGIQEVIVNLPDVHEPATMERLATLIAAVRSLQAARA
jgi:F420-dependent oxidoreductase-like protein